MKRTAKFKNMSSWILFLSCIFSFNAYGQVKGTQQNASDTTKEKGRLIEGLTYETHSGLPIAASKIYFSDRKFTVSGFGEINYINYRGPKDRASEDIELYMTNLYRFVSYLAYRPKPWLVLYGEVFAELLQDGNREYHPEAFIEIFADFLVHKRFNARIGTHQVQLGYVNTHDEPVMFYSVNRPDVERIIIPSQWIDMGIMTYGNITRGLDWSLGVFQGLDGANFNSASWIRRGRDDQFRFIMNTPLINSKVEFTRIKNTTLSLSGIYNLSGANKVIDVPGGERILRAPTKLISSYAKTSYSNWTFMILGALGSMDDTQDLYRLNGEVLGSRVYGMYMEVGYDIMPLLRGRRSLDVDLEDRNPVFRRSEFKLPVFARYERLNTHASVHPELLEAQRFQTDLHALTVGVNFNTRKAMVFKGNYQFRWNNEPLSTGEREGNRVELGMGFIF